MDVMGKISPWTAAASPASSWRCITCSKLHPTELHSIKENISCYSGAPPMGQILRTALSTRMHQVSEFPAAAKAHVCPLTASQAPTGGGLSRANRCASRFKWRLRSERLDLSGLRTCPVFLHHAVHTGSVCYASGRCVAQVPRAAVSGLAVEAMKASVMGQLLVESWHAPICRAFLHASVAGGCEPLIRGKKSAGYLSSGFFKHIAQHVCTRKIIWQSWRKLNWLTCIRPEGSGTAKEW